MYRCSVGWLCPAFRCTVLSSAEMASTSGSSLDLSFGRRMFACSCSHSIWNLQFFVFFLQHNCLYMSLAFRSSLLPTVSMSCITKECD
jgi:hypothetical protein